MSSITAGQAPVHAPGLRLNQIAQDAIARGLLAVQHLSRVQKTPDPSPPRRNVQPHFEVAGRQTVQPGILAAEPDRP